MYDDRVAVDAWLEGVLALVEERDLDAHLVGPIPNESFVGGSSVGRPGRASQCEDDGRHHGRFPTAVGAGQKVETLVRGVDVFLVAHEILEVDLENHAGLAGPSNLFRCSCLLLQVVSMTGSLLTGG